MTRAIATRIPRAALSYGVALTGVGAMSALIGIVLGLAPIGKVSSAYLIVVLAIAARLGRGPAVVSSLAAFLTYDFFFTTPYHEFTISDPDEWVSLGLFLITALITSEIAANERRRAEEARSREREAVLLFDVLRLMTEPDLERALGSLAERVRRELRVEAVELELVIANMAHTGVAGTDEARSLLDTTSGAATRIMPGAHEPTPHAAARPRRWVRVLPPRAPGYELLGRWRRYRVPLRVGDRGVGRITLVRAREDGFGPAEDRFLAGIATQLSLLVQRGELQASATEAELLRRANEVKTALLNAVSHDLRTPLASILASAESLMQRDVRWTDEDRDEFARAIAEQSRRLDRLVGDLLDLSRLEAGALRPHRELHDLAALIHDVVGRARASPGRIAVLSEAELPPVMVDEVEIDHVLSNLLENALKYSPADTVVELSARVEDAEIVTEVADRGPGIPDDALHSVFEPFYRVGGPAARPSGLGLGLAVAKGLVEANGGRIWVEPGVDGGARFCFALPVARERETVQVA